MLGFYSQLNLSEAHFAFVSLVSEFIFSRRIEAALNEHIQKNHISAESRQQIYPLPNFLVIGGFKCGTTSLYHYLKRHPSIRGIQQRFLLPNSIRIQIQEYVRMVQQHDILRKKKPFKSKSMQQTYDRLGKNIQNHEFTKYHQVYRFGILLMALCKYIKQRQYTYAHTYTYTRMRIRTEEIYIYMQLPFPLQKKKKKKCDIDFKKHAEELRRLSKPIIGTKEARFFDMSWTKYLFLLAKENTTLMLEWYSQVFGPINQIEMAQRDELLYFEASPGYFTQPQAPKLIQYFLVDRHRPIKLILLLRDPVFRFLSHIRMEFQICLFDLKHASEHVSQQQQQQQQQQRGRRLDTLVSQHRQTHVPPSEVKGKEHQNIGASLPAKGDLKNMREEANSTNPDARPSIDMIWSPSRAVFCECLHTLPIDELALLALQPQSWQALLSVRELEHSIMPTDNNQQKISARKCGVHLYLLHKVQSFLQMGVYHKHLEIWLTLFDLDKSLLVLSSEEFFRNTLHVMQQIEEFLPILSHQKLSEKQWADIGLQQKFNILSTTGNEQIKTTFKETNHTIQQLALYYKPFNRILFEKIQKQFDWT
ncbi:sulfotransferase [Reticulomyxa filosa]|uniref:Sulfotransferase n=1 Tax=Reticulomyxa filosa TaxID=46433 RepID=X6P2H4_RETFI|nr:sulfotransferase [Reticulomyxa filosa]|eukprot:ETO31762.1 sulfotransferase [Reticulomyxa filosa]